MNCTNPNTKHYCEYVRRLTYPLIEWLTDRYVRTGFSLNALKGDGAKHGIMDKTTKNGYEPSYVAEQAVLAAENGTESIVLADWKGRLAIMLHYWMPSLLTWYLSRNAKKE